MFGQTMRGPGPYNNFPAGGFADASFYHFSISSTDFIRLTIWRILHRTPLKRCRRSYRVRKSCGDKESVRKFGLGVSIHQADMQGEKQNEKVAKIALLS